MYVGEENQKFFKFYGAKDRELIFTPHAVNNEYFQDQYKNQYNFINIDKNYGNYAENILDFENVDYIIHLAGISGVKDCEENYDQALIDNISSTIHLIKASWAFNIPMIFTSSQATKTPSSSLYATTKRMGEVEAERYNNQCGNIKVLRLSNVFGGKYYVKNKSSVIAKFINNIRNKESLIVTGDGSQTRDFIHVSEVCRAINSCLNDTKISHPIDLGIGKGRTIKEVAQMLSDDIVYDNESSIGVESNIADTSDIYNYLGFQAEDKLEEYINKGVFK